MAKCTILYWITKYAGMIKIICHFIGHIIFIPIKCIASIFNKFQASSMISLEFISSIESMSVLFLIFIIIFRRRLSSNDEYRTLGSKPARFRPIRNFILYLRTTKTYESISRYLVKVVAIHLLPYLQFLYIPNLKPEGTNKMKRSVGSGQPIVSTTQTDSATSTDEVKVVKKATTLSDMPRDSIITIASFLGNYKEILAIASLCRYLHDTIASDSLWEHLWMTKYYHIWTHPKIIPIREKRLIFWDPVKVIIYHFRLSKYIVITQSNIPF
jgi:hypothetical protein